MGKITFSLGDFEYKDPVLIYRYSKDGTIGEKEMLDILRKRKEAIGDRPVVVLSILTGMPDFSAEARRIAALPENTQGIIAHAAVIKWVAQKLLADVFTQINKPDYPIRTFDNEKEALQWLMAEWKSVKSVR